MILEMFVGAWWQFVWQQNVVGKGSTHYCSGDCGLNRNTADNLSAWGRTGEGKRYNVSKVQLCSSEGADLGTPDP